MDYKEKYEQALKTAKLLADNTDDKICKEKIEAIFPELIDSEDEKIRKQLLNWFKDCHWDTIDNGTLKRDDIIAWLEKQGHEGKKWIYEDVYIQEKEQVFQDGIDEVLENPQKYGLEKHGERKSAWSEEDEKMLDIITEYFDWGIDYFFDENDCNKAQDWLKSLKERLQPQPKQGEQKSADTSKFKVGDWVINEHGFIMQIVDVQDGNYVYMYKLEKLSATIEQMEDSCHLWTIQDAKDGDVLVYKNEIFMIKSYTLWHKIVYHCCYDGEDLYTHSIYDCWGKEDFDKVHPATKEQRDLLFQKMKEAGYEWDAETKELKKIESDFSCSEEDDKVFKAIYEDLHTYYTLKANMLVYDTYKKEYEKKWENAKKWLEEHVAP